MQKIIRFNNTVIAILSDGNSYQREGLSDKEFNSLMAAKTDEDILSIMNPEYENAIRERQDVLDILSKADKSKRFTVLRDAIYWPEVSMLSVPKELVQVVLEAEEAGDEVLLETYRNFWTLMCLNPSEECRHNLFWFLSKWGMKISRSGFFVAYRNVDIHKRGETVEDSIFTDHYTHTFRIKIGEIVTQDRDRCDCDSNVSCSKGLHLGGQDWLNKNYFGQQGLVCLCNPAEVVAVPYDDNYGKLRCCAYLPIKEAEFDDSGKVIPLNESDGFECQYVPKVIYEGLMGTEKDTHYKLEIPAIPGIDRQSIADRLLDIAREAIVGVKV
jgi:hypothetical protein